MDIKVVIVQSIDMHSENLGDGDDGYQFKISYKLYSNVPKLLFAQSDWIRTYYLCKCELEPKEYFLLNCISAQEETISYNPETQQFIQDYPIRHIGYIPKLSEFSDPYWHINYIKTERFRNIFNASNSPQYLIAQKSNINIGDYKWISKSFDKDTAECKYEIDLIEDTNVKELSLPNYIGKDTIDIYLCLPSIYIQETNSVIYYLASNIPNAFEFIPYEICSELFSFITCKSWEQKHRGDYIKGEKICVVIQRINEVIKRWGNISKKIKFHVGNELICQHRIPVDLLFQKNRINLLISQLKGK